MTVFIWLQGWDDKYVSIRIDWDYSSGGKDGDDKYLSAGMDGMRRIHLVISPVIPVSEVSPPSHKSYLGGTGVIPATVSRWLSSRPPNWKSIPKICQLPWKIGCMMWVGLPQGISGGPWPDDRQQTQQVRGWHPSPIESTVFCNLYIKELYLRHKYN
jgi:hypothetical protein